MPTFLSSFSIKVFIIETFYKNYFYIGILYNSMEVSFDEIINGNWYKIPQYISEPVRIYKMERNGNYYIKTKTNQGQMTIIKIPNNKQKILKNVEEDDSYLTDEEDIPDDYDEPLEDLDQISYNSYGENEFVENPEDWNEILTNFDAIEKMPTGGKKKTKRRKQMKTKRRKQRKTMRRKQRKTMRRKQRKTSRRKP